VQINIISNIDNGHGLQRDYEILRELLAGSGHQVNGVRYDRVNFAQKADVNIFLEMALPVFDPGAENWLIPNPEWFYPHYAPNLSGYSRVLCKTWDAMLIFEGLTDRAEKLGFESRDYYRPEVKRERRFLHVAGKSPHKGTVSIIEAWQRFNIPYPLTVISTRACAGAGNVRVIRRVSDSEYIELLNSHMFHLCPSQYEGWGHCLHEALGVGAVVLTTDAPPMSDFANNSCRIPCARDDYHFLAPLYSASPEAIAEKVEYLMSLSNTCLSEIGAENRSRFLTDQRQFRARLDALIGTFTGEIACAS
jgi:glycosyltransferase involved in cell wall biosynthesis